MEWQTEEQSHISVEADSAFVRDRVQGSGCAHTRVSSSPSTWMVSRKAGGDSLSIAFWKHCIHWREAAGWNGAVTEPMYLCGVC